MKKMSTPPRATALLRAACIHAQRGGALCCRQAVAREADPIPWYPEEADVTDGRLLRWWLWVCNLPRRGGEVLAQAKAVQQRVAIARGCNEEVSMLEGRRPC